LKALSLRAWTRLSLARLRPYADGNVGMQAVPGSVCLYALDTLDAGYVFGGMMDFIDDAGLDAVQHVRQHGLG
jgi:hypothetical protein